MATSGQPRSSALDHPTRQQLDELDALMQRMLALPVNPMEEPPDEPPKQPPNEDMADNAGTAPAAVPSPVAAAKASDAEDAVKKRLADTVLPHASQQEVLGTPSPVLDAEYRAPAPAASKLSTRYAVRATPPTPSPRPPILPSPAPPPAVSEVTVLQPPFAWPLRPLLWLNLAFDQSTTWLGPLGGWLRGPSGRALLGWGGLLLLAAALVWLVWDGMAWSW
jgi:hypothetical protein